MPKLWNIYAAKADQTFPAAAAMLIGHFFRSPIIDGYSLAEVFLDTDKFD